MLLNTENRVRENNETNVAIPNAPVAPVFESLRIVCQYSQPRQQQHLIQGGVLTIGNLAIGKLLSIRWQG